MLLGTVAFDLSHTYSKLSPFAPHDKDILTLFTLKVIVFDKGCRVTLGKFTTIQKEKYKLLHVKNVSFSCINYIQLIIMSIAQNFDELRVIKKLMNKILMNCTSLAFKQLLEKNLNGKI